MTDKTMQWFNSVTGKWEWYADVADADISSARHDPYEVKGNLVITDGVYANAGDTPQPDPDARIAALESEVTALKAREEYHQAEIDTLQARVEALEMRSDPKYNPR